MQVPAPLDRCHRASRGVEDQSAAVVLLEPFRSGVVATRGQVVRTTRDVSLRARRPRESLLSWPASSQMTLRGTRRSSGARDVVRVMRSLLSRTLGTTRSLARPAFGFARWRSRNFAGLSWLVCSHAHPNQVFARWSKGAPSMCLSMRCVSARCWIGPSPRPRKFANVKTQAETSRSSDEREKHAHTPR